MNIEVNRLLAKISRGDTAALETLYGLLKNGVYLYALSMLKSRESAEDVLQDTFVRIFERAGTHAPGRDGRAWIFTIVHNMCLDRLKSSSRSVLPLDSGEEQMIPANADFVRDLELKEALLQLEEKPRSVLLLHLAAGLRFREIAGLLNEKQSSVERLYYSSVKKLSSCYEAAQSKGADSSETGL